MVFVAAHGHTPRPQSELPRCQNNDTMKWYGRLVRNETARQRSPESVHSVLWLSSMNPVNNFETTCTLISAIYLMQSQNLTERRWELRWHFAQQHYFPRLLGHGGTLAAIFVKHVWRNGRLQRPVSALVAPTCFADAAEVHSFTFLNPSFGGAALERATRTFQRMVWRHFAVPPGLQPSMAQLARQPVAVLLQRRGARAIINEEAVVALIQARGFALHDVIIPEEVSLLSLLASMRRASLAVAIHGAGMINQVFMPVGVGAVIEAFQPHMFYGTGFQIAAACAFHHQPLFLEPSHADLTAVTNLTAFQASPFGRWRGWTNDSLATALGGCIKQRARWAAGGLIASSRTMCGGVWKSLQYRLPLPRLALLLDSARHALRSRAPSAAPSPGARCLPRVMLEPSLKHGLRVRGLPPKVRLRPIAHVLSSDFLRRIGFCGVSRLSQAGGAARPAPQPAVWLRMHGAKASAAPPPVGGVVLEFVPEQRDETTAAFHHPRHLRSFCEAPTGGSAAEMACVVRVEELAALLQAALAYLTPTDPPNLVSKGSTAQQLTKKRPCCIISNRSRAASSETIS